ncbi:MAG: hypothetical protein IT533_15655 [Hyphomicrobiales bacterium]|nr:hypothetical protein [Hyphomicrobiales bacterium]
MALSLPEQLLLRLESFAVQMLADEPDNQGGLLEPFGAAVCVETLGFAVWDQNVNTG